MLERDVDKRLTAREVLEHKWFSTAPSKEFDPDLSKFMLTSLSKFSVISTN
jgi:hypothetical protein